MTSSPRVQHIFIRPPKLCNRAAFGVTTEGFTNRKSKYRRPDGRIPFVQLRSHTGRQYPMAEAFYHQITALYVSVNLKFPGYIS